MPNKTAPQLTDAQMVNARDLWPRWPLLPLKRTNAEKQLDYGFLYADNASDADGVYVYCSDMFTFAALSKEARLLVERKEYPTVAAMLADGWRVD